MIDKYKIKQCECGGRPRILIGWIAGINFLQFTNGFYVACPDCNEMSDMKGTKRAAANIWNRRKDNEQEDKLQTLQREEVLSMQKPEDLPRGVMLRER